MRNIIKRTIVAAVCVIMVLSLAACGGTNILNGIYVLELDGGYVGYEFIGDCVKVVMFDNQGERNSIMENRPPRRYEIKDGNIHMYRDGKLDNTVSIEIKSNSVLVIQGMEYTKKNFK